MIEYRRDQDIVCIGLSNPPINAGCHALRAGLLDAITRAGREEGLKGVVLYGVGPHFMAGSDLKEFGAPLDFPQLPDVIAAIGALPLPVVAAIDGLALGGGYELSLGCDARVATTRATVGLPEVGLGILPGAGGTQRLPRLVGRVRAMELILGTRRVGAEEALTLGMVDALCAPETLLDTAAETARGMSGKSPVLARPYPPEDPEALDAAEASALRRARNRPAARAAAEMIRLGADLAPAEGLARERALFQDLRLSPEARALRHIFFAERAAMKPPAGQALKLDRIAIVGAGTMGAGIAAALCLAGIDVLVLERDQGALDAGLQRIGALLDEAARRGKPARGAVSGTTVAGDLAAMPLVIEAVFETLEAKTEVLARLDAVLSEHAIIATNTSYLSLDDLAAGTSHPHRVVGLHFFAPAQIMSLVEVVFTAKTDADALATAHGLVRRLGKQPIVVRDSWGFAGNRIYASYRAQAERALLDGAGVAAVDAAMEAFGMAMGPFAVADLSGLDIARAMRNAQRAQGATLGAHVLIPDALCEAGRLGRKTGGGYYDYENGKRGSDVAAMEAVAAVRTSLGVAPQDLSASDIQSRLLAAILLEASRLLAEGVCGSRDDIDVALVHGYGFPRWTGGPIHWACTADRTTKEALVRDIRQQGASESEVGDVVAFFLEG